MPSGTEACAVSSVRHLSVRLTGCSCTATTRQDPPRTASAEVNGAAQTAGAAGRPTGHKVCASSAVVVDTERYVGHTEPSCNNIVASLYLHVSQPISIVSPKRAADGRDRMPRDIQAAVPPKSGQRNALVRSRSAASGNESDFHGLGHELWLSWTLWWLLRLERAHASWTRVRTCTGPQTVTVTLCHCLQEGPEEGPWELSLSLPSRVPVNGWAGLARPQPHAVADKCCEVRRICI